MRLQEIHVVAEKLYSTGSDVSRGLLVSREGCMTLQTILKMRFWVFVKGLCRSLLKPKFEASTFVAYGGTRKLESN